MKVKSFTDFNLAIWRLTFNFEVKNKSKHPKVTSKLNWKYNSMCYFLSKIQSTNLYWFVLAFEFIYTIYGIFISNIFFPSIGLCNSKLYLKGFSKRNLSKKNNGYE